MCFVAFKTTKRLRASRTPIAAGQTAHATKLAHRIRRCRKRNRQEIFSFARLHQQTKALWHQNRLQRRSLLRNLNKKRKKKRKRERDKTRLCSSRHLRGGLLDDLLLLRAFLVGREIVVQKIVVVGHRNAKEIVVLQQTTIQLTATLRCLLLSFFTCNAANLFWCSSACFSFKKSATAAPCSV